MIIELVQRSIDGLERGVDRLQDLELLEREIELLVGRVHRIQPRLHRVDARVGVTQTRFHAPDRGVGGGQFIADLLHDASGKKREGWKGREGEGERSAVHVGGPFEFGPGERGQGGWEQG